MQRGGGVLRAALSSSPACPDREWSGAAAGGPLSSTAHGVRSRGLCHFLLAFLCVLSPGGKASCNPFGKEAGVQVRRVRAIQVETAWPDLPPVPRAEAGDPVVAHAGSWCGPSTAVALPGLGDCPPGLTTDTWELGPALSVDGGAGTRLPCRLAWTPLPGPPSLPPGPRGAGPPQPCECPSRRTC